MLLPPLLRAKFVSRPNRFAVWAELRGKRVYCHMPNPGRMLELLREGVELWLRAMPGAGRRTTHQVVLARHGSRLVCLDSRLPPVLFLEGLEAGLLPELGTCPDVRHEVPHGRSRLDLELRCDSGRWLVETKSCTLVEEGVARFPDAPTLRGARHMIELAQARQRGFIPAVAFIIQRSDARCFAPNDATDPAFGDALRKAVASGVEVYAVKCEVSRQAVTPVERVPVQLGSGSS